MPMPCAPALRMERSLTIVGVGGDEVGRGGRGRLAVAAVVVLGEQGDVAFGGPLAEGDGPLGLVAGVGRAGDVDARSLRHDGRAELLPYGLEGGDRPGCAGVVGAAVEVRLVADLDAEQRGTQLRGDVGDLFRGECGRGGGGEGSAGVGRGAGAAEVDAVEALPAGGFQECGERIHVCRGDLPGGLASAGGRPDVAVDGVAADAQNAGAEALEEADEVGV